LRRSRAATADHLRVALQLLSGDVPRRMVYGHVGWRKIRPVIAHQKRERARRGRFDRESYRRRNLIERCVNGLKESRRIATRYEKLALHYLGMLRIGMTLRYLTT